MKPVKIEKHNMLQIIKEVDMKWKYRMIECVCDCWNTIITYLHTTKNWHTKSCWCLNTKWRETHWLRNTPIYNTFRAIINRTTNIKYDHYKHYWWRWIKNEWNCFEDFYNDMNVWYKKWLSIDRIDVNWNYCKSNCRWIPLIEQQDNKQNTVYLNWETVSKWIKRTWLSPSTFYRRIKSCTG